MSVSNSDEELLFLGLDAVYSTIFLSKERREVFMLGLGYCGGLSMVPTVHYSPSCELRIRWH